MSYGERSCKRYYGKTPCGYNPTFETCNVFCDGYLWDGKTQNEFDRIRSSESKESKQQKKAIRFCDMSKGQKRKFRKKNR